MEQIISAAEEKEVCRNFISLFKQQPLVQGEAFCPRHRKAGALSDSGFRQPPRGISSSLGGRLLQTTGVAGGDDLAADAPVAVFDFVDFNQRIRAQRFAFDGDHDFGHFLDHLLLLRRREHVFDYLNIYQWHFVSFQLLTLIFAGSFSPVH